MEKLQIDDSENIHPIISLECLICYEEYNLKARKPMILECGHTICNVCLSGISSTSKKCPMDNKHFSKPPEQYAVNYIYADIISYYKSKSNSLKELPNYREINIKEGKYCGQVKSREIPQGKGKLIHNDGSIYEGEWNNGLK
jgi:hypothetical protein